MYLRSSTTALSVISISLATIASQTAFGEIDYRVTVKPEVKLIQVEMKIPAKAGQVDVQMPSWMPGAYIYGDFFNSVKDVIATDPKHNALAVTHPDKNTWRVVAPKDETISLDYTVETGGRRGMFTGGATDSNYSQISGAQTYMYVVGRKLEPCKITYVPPAGWPVISSLDPAKEPNTYTAPTYDVLADGPVSMGDIIVLKYQLRGKDHFVVLEGAAKKQVDQAKLLKDCRFVSAAETDFFGGAPYHRYVWHFTVFPAPDGAGGLEHLSSTQIQLASGEGHRSQSVLAHEYFHLWNVKRIRSYPLGPFDYLTLPKTGALWWLEGVTDYYASLIPYRYREWTRPEFFEQIVSNVDSVRNNPAYNEVGASDSSLRVAEAEEGRGNSNGYKISYYNLGWLGGFCLDTELRARTNNHHSLDDVVHALYDLCKDSKPGFEEDEIRKQCIRFGGPEMGPYYDQVILKAGQMPIDGQLAKMGLKLVETEEKFADVGFKAMPMRNGARGLRVTSVSASAAGSLKPGDIITSLNGQSLTGDDMMVTFRAMTALQSKAEVGKTISVTFTREGKSTDATVTTVESTRKVRKIQEDPAASKAAIALREGWLKTKSPAVM